MTEPAVAPHDPRWEWIEFTAGDGASWWVRSKCLHRDVVPVESDGVVVAHLCRTCDQQLPEEWHGG